MKHCHYTGKYRGTTRTICKLRFNVSNEITIAFHDGLNYDYHFIIKELGNKFEVKFECLGENTGKWKIGNKTIVTISYKRKFIHGARFKAI